MLADRAENLITENEKKKIRFPEIPKSILRTANQSLMKDQKFQNLFKEQQTSLF